MEVVGVRAAAGVAGADELVADLGDELRTSDRVRGSTRAAHLLGHLRRGFEAEGAFLVDRHRDVLLLRR